MIIPRKLLGDCRDTLQTLPENSVHCCITSPPYWGLRSYLPAGHPMKPQEIGSEFTLELYIEHLVEVFRAVRRAMREDGTLWLNLGDSYANDGKWGGETGGKQAYHDDDNRLRIGREKRTTGLKSKDLCMVPFRVALALQADGWYLRSVIPWLKRNAMPESVEDRPATATEYIFLLSKSASCFYDRHAVMLGCSANTHQRLAQARVQKQFGGSKQQSYLDMANGPRSGRKSRDRTPSQILRHLAGGVGPKAAQNHEGSKQNASFSAACAGPVTSRNRRNSDWFFETFQGLLCDEEGSPLAFIVNPKGTRIAHFASYPPKLVEPIIKAATSEPCTVLDPFWGTGCTGMVATQLGRNSIGCEIHPDYFKDSDIRDSQTALSLL